MKIKRRKSTENIRREGAQKKLFITIEITQ